MYIPNKGDDSPVEFIPRGAFKGTLELDCYSRSFEVGLFAEFAEYPLGYDTIGIDAKAAITRRESTCEVINRLISRCSNTLEVLDINFRDEYLCKSGPSQP